MDYTVYVAGAFGLLGTIVGALLTHILSRGNALASDLRTFLTDAYTQVTANYLLFIDRKATRSEIVGAIEKASILCPQDIKKLLLELESAVIVVQDVHRADMTSCRIAHEAFLSAARSEIQKMWKDKNGLKHILKKT